VCPGRRPHPDPLLPASPPPQPPPPHPPQVHVAREFMRSMAQPYDRQGLGRSLLSQEAVNALAAAQATAGLLGPGPA
jgi:hypothetical protein